MAQKIKKSCERKQQATTNKVAEKSVDQCLDELGLDRKNLQLYLLLAARALREHPFHDENGKIDPEGSFIASHGAASLSSMLDTSCDAEEAMKTGLDILESIDD